MMKRTIVLLSMALVAIAVVAQSTGWSAGQGTLQDPYQIKSAQDLQALAADVNAGKTFNGVYFKMTSDVNLGNVCNEKLNKSWTPIGVTGTDGFSGFFDGDNHVVSGLYINNKDDKQGLFGYLNHGSIKNVVLKDCYVTANSQVAGIVGLNSGTINNCVIQGGLVSVIGSFSDGGMIAGSCKNGAIDGCRVEKAKVSGNYSCNIGFVTGKADGSLICNNEVTGAELSGGVHKGAILGYNAGKMKLEKNYYALNIKGVKGGCDDKDVNNSKNPDGAVKSDKLQLSALSMIATSVAKAAPAAKKTTPAVAKKAAETKTAPAAKVATPNVPNPVKALAQNLPQNKTYSEAELWPSSSQTAQSATGSSESELWPSTTSAKPKTITRSETAVKSEAPAKPKTQAKPEVQTSAQKPIATAAAAKQEVAAVQPAVVPSVKSADSPKAATNNSYIVKTKGVQPVTNKVKAVTVANDSINNDDESGPTDFMGKNFRYMSMCDWKDGMRFMVVPEKYDMLVNTFCDAATGKEVSSNRLRHKIMVYKGHEDMTNGRVHVNFVCEDDKKNYYYELPNGTFDDYCFGKLGVPTLAYLGDVDKARELLMNQVLLTRTEFFREDTEWNGDGFREVKYPKNKVVTVKAIGVGTRSYPVKIIVEDDEGNQFYQNVAMSRINSGMRDDEFDVDKEKFLFQGSFEYTGGEMAVSSDIRSYLNQTVHTKVSTAMSSKGSGKVRDVKVPRFTGFIIDEINPVKDSPYHTLTLRETETRRIYYKDVLFKEQDLMNYRDATRDDYFGYIFGMGEGALHNTSLETRTAIREGRVIPGMSEDEVLMAVGEPFNKVKDSKGVREWLYNRSNGVLLVVQFNAKGKVIKAGGRATKTTNASSDKKTKKKAESKGNEIPGGTMKTGTPL